MFPIRMTLLILLLAITPLAAQDRIPSEQIFPATTQGWISVADLNQFNAKLKETQFGQLIDDPAMQEFVEDLNEQLKEKRGEFGLTWDDLLSIAGGETALAIIHQEGKRPAHVAMVDATGKFTNVAGVVNRLDQELTKRGATVANEDIQGQSVRVYTKENKIRLIYFTIDNWLIATDTRESVSEIIPRIKNATSGNPAADSLAQDAAFIAVRDRLQKDLEASSTATDARWYAQPIGLAQANRTLQEIEHPEQNQGSKRRDFLRIAKETGFAGVKGAGGIISLRTEQYDILNRIAIYAPRPWEMSLNMISLRNIAEHTVGNWINQDVATHTSFDLDPVASFDSFKWVFDALFDGEGSFVDVMDGIAQDPIGPRVNIRDQIVAQMTGRVTLITDNQEPINSNSQRRLLAFPIEEGKAAGVKAALDRLMEPEPNTSLRTNLIQGVEIWELRQEESEVTEASSQQAQIIPVVSVSGPNGQGNVVEPPAMERLESAAICVANGQMLYASHISFLVEVLQSADSRRKLADDIALEMVDQQLDAEISNRGWAGVSLRRFGRTDEEVRTSYELARANRLHESESITSRIIRNLAGDSSEEGRDQGFDGSKLPDFQIVRRFLQPSGQITHTETQDMDGFDGWFILSATFRDRRTESDETQSDGQDGMKVDDAKR